VVLDPGYITAGKGFRSGTHRFTAVARWGSWFVQRDGLLARQASKHPGPDAGVLHFGYRVSGFSVTIWVTVACVSSPFLKPD